MRTTKTKSLTFVLLLASFTGCAGEVGESYVYGAAEGGSNLQDNEWRLTYADEFDTLDLGKYNTQYIWDRTTIINGERQFYVDPAQHGHNPFSIHNGALRITAEKTPDHVKWATAGQPYVSGVLTSRQKFEQKYGRFEIRAKLPAGRGLWPAFWMLPTHDQWPGGVSMLAELDVMEFIGHEGSFYHTTRHTNEGSQRQHGSAVNTEANLTDEFHKYAVVWNASEIVWYFDDREVFRSDTPSDFHHPKHFLLNLAVGGWWPGNPDNSTVLPAHFEVDYVRVYEHAGSNHGETNTTNGNQGNRLEPVHGQRAQAYSKRSAEIFWKSAATNPGNVRFDIYRDGSHIKTTTGRSHFMNDLEQGRTYNIEIQATADGHESSETRSVTFTTEGGAPASGAAQPSGDIAPASNLRGTVYGGNPIEVFWDRSSVPGVEYEVYRGDVHLGNTDGASYFDGNTEPNKTYEYRVYAVNANTGERSAASNTWIGQTPD